MVMLESSPQTNGEPRRAHDGSSVPTDDAHPPRSRQALRALHRHRYQRPPEPVYFPTSEEVPETKSHMKRRAVLYASLEHEIAASATIGSDQFVYWDPTTSDKRLAPDVFVRLGTPDHTFDLWKTWKHGAPDLGVEFVSASDKRKPVWEEKLERYRAAGIAEVVRFDPKDAKRQVRVWDAIDGDLVERAEDDPDRLACETLGLWWTVVEHPTFGPMLRLSRDREGRDLLLTPEELEAKAREAEAKARDESTKAREAEAKAREAEAKAREAEAKAREANERLEAEVAALRAKLAEGKPRKRR